MNMIVGAGNYSNYREFILELGHTQYILWSTDPDRHIFALSEEKKMQFPSWLVSEKKQVNFDKFKLIHIPIVLKKSLFSYHVGGKIKIKAGRLLFFLVGDNFYMLEDLLTVKYTESGLIWKNRQYKVASL